MSKPKKISQELYNFLTDFGLSEREIDIYLCLLKTGPNTIMNISRETGIKRSTTHNNVEELVNKGLISQTNRGEKRLVVAEDPEKLKFLVEQKKWKIKKVDESVGDVVKLIKNLVPDDAAANNIEVKYYQGIDNVQLVYKEAFKSHELKSFVNLNATSEVFPDNKLLFLDAHAKSKSLKVWEIVDDTPETVDFAKMYQQRANFKFKVTDKIKGLDSVNILLYSDKIALINIKDSVTAAIIQNSEYNKVMTNIFNIVWDSIS